MGCRKNLSTWIGRCGPRALFHLSSSFFFFLFFIWLGPVKIYFIQERSKKMDASSVKKKNKNKNQLTAVWYPRVYRPWNIHHLQMLTQLKLRVMHDDYLFFSLPFYFTSFSLALFLFSTFSFLADFCFIQMTFFRHVCFFILSLLNEWTGDSCVTFEMSRRPSVRSAPVNAKCPSTPPINLCRRCRYTHTQPRLCVCVCVYGQSSC